VQLIIQHTDTPFVI